MICPKCKTKVSEYDTKCPKCELKLIFKCPRCGSLTRLGSVSCKKCGFTFDRMGSYSKFDGSATFESKHYVQNWERITYMNLRQTPFDSIASGNKTIELRLWDEKRQNLQVGDTLAFTCGNKVAVCKVKDLLLFPTFKDLYNNVDLLQCGYDQESVKNASHKDMEEYYTIEEQQQYGVVGIQVELYCVYQKNN